LVHLNFGYRIYCVSVPSLKFWEVILPSESYDGTVINHRNVKKVIN
jgi:hypothetical protein